MFKFSLLFLSNILSIMETKGAPNINPKLKNAIYFEASTTDKRYVSEKNRIPQNPNKEVDVEMNVNIIIIGLQDFLLHNTSDSEVFIFISSGISSFLSFTKENNYNTETIVIKDITHIVFCPPILEIK